MIAPLKKKKIESFTNQKQYPRRKKKRKKRKGKENTSFPKFPVSKLFSFESF